MKKKLSLLLLASTLGVCPLASCNGGDTSSSVETDEGVLEYQEFLKDWSISQNSGEDGVRASLDNAELGSYDDLITITAYKGTATEVTVPSEIRGLKIVGIAKSTFRGKSNITKIVLPETIETITDSAMSNMTSLSSMNLPENTIVSPGAFDGTDYLLNTYVKEVNGLDIVNNNGIYGIAGDEITGTVNIPEGVLSVPDNIFEDQVGVTGVTIPSTVTSIGEAGFAGTSLVDVTIPNTVTTIGEEAFANITTLQSYKEFDVEGDTSRVISYTSDSPAVLSGSTDNLTTVNYSGTVPLVDMLDQNEEEIKVTNVALNGETIIEECLIDIPSIKNLTLADNVVFVDTDALNNLSGLQSFSPTAYSETTRLAYINSDREEEGSFFNSTVYQNIVNGTAENSYVILGGAVTEKKGTPAISSLYDKSIKGYADNLFKDDATVTDDVAASLKLNEAYALGASSFEGTAITSIDLTANGTYLGKNALAQISSLKTVKLAGDMIVSNGALLGSTNVETLEGPITQTKATLFGSSTIKLSSVVISEGVTSIPDRAFEEVTSLKSVTLPSTVEKIGTRSFRRTGLTEVYIPYSVKEINQLAFAECDSLKTVTFQDVKVFGEGADKYNREDSVDIGPQTPNRLSIYAMAFGMCKNLDETFVLPFRVKDINQILIGSSVKTIEVRLTDFDRNYNPVEGFNPETMTNRTLTFSTGFNQTGFTAEEGDPNYPNPVGADLVIVGEGLTYNK